MRKNRRAMFLAQPHSRHNCLNQRARATRVGLSGAITTSIHEPTGNPDS
jgi:hypothetical protein